MDPPPPDKRNEQLWRLAQERNRERYEAGDLRALATAIRIANMFYTPLPIWANVAFSQAYDTGKLRNVFGPDRPGAPRDADRSELMWQVWTLVEAKGKKGDAVFGEIGEELGMGENAERRVSRLYYEAEKLNKALLAMLDGKKPSGN